MSKDVIIDKITKDFRFFIFSVQNRFNISEVSSLKDHISIMDFDHETGVPSEALPNSNIIGNIANYGTVCGLYYLWKNTAYEYYGFSLINQIPRLSEDSLNSFLHSNKDLLYIKPQLCKKPLQENYRTLYYSYDFRMLISILKKYYPNYYEFSQKDYVDIHEFYLPTVIMSKNTFRKFCVWAFPILERCNSILNDKYSVFQNYYIEHLSYYLIGLYIRYNSSLRTEVVDEFDIVPYTSKSSFDLAATLSPSDAVQMLLDARQIEKAVEYVNSNNSSELKPYREMLERYERERRYYKNTILESFHTLTDFAALFKNVRHIDKTKNVLVLRWNSVSHNETLLALSALGLTYDCFDIGDIKSYKKEQALDGLNYYLDSHSYDCIFSLNYFQIAAEACYIHETPYIAWTYDSPITIEDYKIANYPTTNIFLFDSKETDRFEKSGLKTVKYMPLAVNVDKYDSIICTPEDHKRFDASVSFVGSLYANKLNEAMRSLTDYQKAYINSLIDNSLHTRNYNLLEEIITESFMEFISNNHFNKIINSEWDDDLNNTKNPHAGRLLTLINKTITNKERLLIISMLSNHWDFKLYSYSTHELFKKTIECGSIDYYTEMPKAFKCSKINLNITLRNIQTGIPLRCLDIMGCHSALLSNHQKDFDNHFFDGKNIIFYDYIEEAYDKVDYYLKNDSALAKIADNGYKTVKENYNYPHLMKQVLIESGLTYLFKGTN